MMTKKTYIEAAKIVKNHIGDGPGRERLVIAKAFRDLFMNDNPRFDATRFFDACGIPEYKRV